MDMLRTPDSCFAGLPDYDFTPHYTTITAADGTDIRIHHIDEGNRSGDPILLMHGNPTWSYIHRHMIRMLAERTDRRIIAVDLVGCGRSDKPESKDDYSLANHYDWMVRWLRAVDLSSILLYCQDWGGTIGLYLSSVEPERFSGVVVSNSGMPLGEGSNAFLDGWLKMMASAEEFPWEVLSNGMPAKIRPEELAAYKAPFPTTAYQKGIVKFPMLIAVRPDNPEVELNRDAWKRLGSFDKPFLTLFGANDPAAGGVDRRLVDHIPGARGQPHETHPQAGHFIQEEDPEWLVERIAGFSKRLTGD